jgi:hypothetical protein
MRRLLKYLAEEPMEVIAGQACGFSDVVERKPSFGMAVNVIASTLESS